jgi:hypothetical protein
MLDDVDVGGQLLGHILALGNRVIDVVKQAHARMVDGAHPLAASTVWLNNTPG